MQNSALDFIVIVFSRLEIILAILAHHGLHVFHMLLHTRQLGRVFHLAKVELQHRRCGFPWEVNTHLVNGVLDTAMLLDRGIKRCSILAYV